MPPYNQQNPPKTWPQLALRTDKWGKAWYDWGRQAREDIIAMEILLKECCYNGSDAAYEKAYNAARKQARKEIAAEKAKGDPGEPPKKPWR